MSEIKIEDYNIRYCKHCGGALLNGKCTKCGITAFSPTKIIIFLLSLACILSLVFNYYQFSVLRDIDAQFRYRFEEYANPETGEPIRTAYDYLDAIDAQMEMEDMSY